MLKSQGRLGVFVRHKVCVLAILQVSYANCMTGQQVEPIIIGVNDVSCASCRIVTEQVVVLGDRDGPGALSGLPISFQRDSEGRFYVVQQMRDEPPLIFDADGRFLERLGRTGDGPGETREARQILVTKGDSLIVFDRGQNRITFYSPDRTVLKTSAGLPHTQRLVRLSDGTLVLNSDLRTRSGVGMPLHLIDPGRPAHIIRSFGSDADVLYYAGTSHSIVRKLGTTRDDEIWAAPEYEYVLEKFSPKTGKRIKIIRREVDWFKPRNPLPATSPTVHPSIFLNAVHEDLQGWLWVLVVVPAKDWQRGLEKSDQVVDGQQQYYQRFDVLYDTVVEVLDQESGTLVASTTFDSFGLEFMEDGLIGAWIQDEEHIPYLEVLRVELVER